MEQNFQTSFIPKKPMIKEPEVSSRPVGILLIISLFILFTVLVVSGGLYFYKASIVKKIADSQENLNRNQNRFEPEAIKKFQLLDKRLKAASEILAKHISVVPIFEALQQLTMKTVRFTRFTYELGTTENPAINIKMSGIAIGYKSIALQSDLFTRNKNLIDPVFSNLNLDASGNVLFDLGFSVDPTFVNYKQALLTQN